MEIGYVPIPACKANQWTRPSLPHHIFRQSTAWTGHRAVPIEFVGLAERIAHASLGYVVVLCAEQRDRNPRTRDRGTHGGANIDGRR